MKDKLYKFYSKDIFTPIHGYPTLIRKRLLYQKYKYKYQQSAPKYNKIYYLDPKKLDYSIYSKDLPRKLPIYGVIDGVWDNKKVYWKDTHWKGLKERFVDGKDWEDTIYYKTGIKKLETGENLRRLDKTQTIESFEEYLKELDVLYTDIKENGYDQSSVITANIGRNGEYLCDHGNHRRTIAIILEIDKIPVKVKYRHKIWQEKRTLAAENPELLDCDVKHHPDINNIINRA